jgi:predicted nucleic acid-binding protein
MPRSTQIYGIDASVFVRLLTGHPEADFAKTAKALKLLHDEHPGTELVVSNQVVGEAYITLQHFYGISQSDARKAILHLFNTGSISPLNGQPIIDILSKSGGAGLMDRLITQDYNQHETTVLTNDKRMAKLEGARLL